MTGYVDQVVGASLFIEPNAAVTKRVGTALVVDDSTVIRKLVGKMLTTMNVPTILDAPNATEGFKLLHENRVDLLICDVEMPDVNGIKLLLAIRRTPRLRDLPVILMTSSLNAAHVRKAQDALADVFLLNPFTGDHLRNKINAAMNREADHARA